MQFIRFHISEFGDNEFFYSGQYVYTRQQKDLDAGWFVINNQSAGNSNRSIWGFALDKGAGSQNGFTLWASSVGPAGDPKWTFTKDSGIVAQNGAGYLQTGLGSAAAPSVSYSADPDTGAFSPAADTWAVSTGGVERLRVKSTGGVRYVPLAAAPATPQEGEVYFDSTMKKLRVYDGTAWADLN